MEKNLWGHNWLLLSSECTGYYIENQKSYSKDFNFIIYL